MPELSQALATNMIDGMLKEMYKVVQELQILQAMATELRTGPRNANDAYAIQNLDARMRKLRRERNTLHRLIHEEPTIQIIAGSSQLELLPPDSQE